MADKLISQLSATASVVATDVFEIEKLAGAPSEKATITQLTTLFSTIYAPITGGAYVLKAGDTMSGLLTITQATANTSVFASTGYSLAGANAQSLMDLAGTWNTTGNPSGLRLAITNTASGATAKLFELLAGAGGVTSMFSVSKAGAVVSAANITAGLNLLSSGDVSVANGGAWINGTRGTFGYTADGVMRLLDFAGTSFGRLMFGGTTSSFPAIKRSGTGLEFKLADDSAYAVITASMLRLTPALTVATLPAAGTQGRIAYVTDALAPAFLAIAVGGGGIITTVFDNGTNWVSV